MFADHASFFPIPLCVGVVFSEKIERITTTTKVTEDRTGGYVTLIVFAVNPRRHVGWMELRLMLFPCFAISIRFFYTMIGLEHLEIRTSGIPSTVVRQVQA
jgi:hypothetical protein